jgi:uncharacterized protein YciI
MLILSLTYIAPIEDADRHMDAHMAWVRAGYDDGTFVASGRKIPRTGGVILAKGDRASLEALCDADPFVVYGIAEYEITEVAFTTVAAGYENLKA